jgi:hypothetical protein
MGWISVEDKLPERKLSGGTGTRVLIYHPDPGIHVRSAIFWHDRQVFDIGRRDSLIDGITHWQPLPEPPTNEEKGE